MRKHSELPIESRRDFLHKACALAALSLAAGRARAGQSAEDRSALMLSVIAAALYPHPALPVALYANAAAAMLAKAGSAPAARQMLDAGLLELDASAGGDWLALAPSAQLASLVQRQNSPFFQFVRGVTALSLYSNPEVWKRFGYGGDAWRFGGYSGKTLNDIDWLPEPAAP